MDGDWAFDGGFPFVARVGGVEYRVDVRRDRYSSVSSAFMVFEAEVDDPDLLGAEVYVYDPGTRGPGS